ncbi:Signal transduction histidine kinase [Flavobacterium swingsii]|jgi:signal transduction histidine kinase/CheY-like chemotaxis protein|uniref:histidine kinase n=1 Tax=Flavobacterium swingsii TaxID=498292 RepID=A0A1I0VCQ5_9FLAO|nr:ATP-binding protein [Flavobacterium swingsii]SFA73823.1 Signal transduction histidine kinase [Flavobacterium swingsii]
MFKRLFLILLFVCSLSVFSRNGQQSVSKVDSSFFYTEKANYFKDNKVFDKALENANKSIVFGQKTNNVDALVSGYYCLATVYIDLKKYDIAIENLLRTVSILNTVEVNSKLALSYYNLGLCYMQKESFSKAESYFQKANSVYESINLSNAVNMVNLQKGLMYLDKKEVSQAEKVFLQISHLPTGKDTFKLQSEALYQLGQIKATEKINNLALNYLNRGYQLSIENKNVNQQIKISKKLSEVYDNMKQTNNSLAFLKIHTRLNDSLNSISEHSDKTLVTERFKVDDMMRSLDKLDKEKKQQEKSNKFSKLINILSIALITILSLLSLSLYKNNIIRNKSNELLRDKNSELEIAKERIEKASKARAEFLSTVSHELRTPLNAINGISHILLDDKPKPSQIEYLKSLKFSGNYLLTYINEILEINRIESDNIEIENISFNIKELLNNIQNSLKEQASQNNNDFNLNIDNEVPEILIGDPTKLSQIFINLINNALKFTENGTITVNAKLINRDLNNCLVKFEIQDTGIGIPKDKQESIFESFSQGSIEINRKYGGTGLGLTIVKRLVTLMNGKIFVNSEIGVGSTFTLNLSFKVGEKITPSTINNLIDEKIFISKKILLVEDNKINQMITKKFLEKKQMLCEICETGEDAISKMQTNQYDLVLMDVHLPGINGTIATAEIRKFNINTPIIALTAISLDENREMLLSYGMNDVITKPFNPDNFYKVIENTFMAETNIV